MMKDTFYTLIFIKEHDRILLGFKKRGLGKNTWNGYGGKLQENEDVLDCAIRELKEESNLIVQKDKLHYLGVVIYDDYHNLTNRRIVHILNVNKVDGIPIETEEMKPKWFTFQNIPYDYMWPDSKFWLPLVLKNSWLFARFTYKHNCEIANYIIEELQEAPTFMNRIQDYTNLKSSQENYAHKNCAICVENV